MRTTPARIVAEGTWITFEEAFAAWGGKTFEKTATNPEVKLPALDDDLVADHWFSDSLHWYAYGSGGSSTDPIWAMRIQELFRCYRTVFRVNGVFRDRIRHLWNVRCSSWDPSTGARAASPVYSNYYFMPADPYRDGTLLNFGTNVMNSYPENARIGKALATGFDVTWSSSTRDS